MARITRMTWITYTHFCRFCSLALCAARPVPFRYLVLTFCFKQIQDLPDRKTRRWMKNLACHAGVRGIFFSRLELTTEEACEF